MPNESRIQVVPEGAVAVLFLHHPPENRLTRSMIDELAGHASRLEKDDGVRAVVVAGAGGHDFCGGLDWDEWGALSPKDAQAAIQRGFEALWALEHLSKPTLAAVEGMCHSAGAELALACDVRFVSASASFRFPEVDRAWMPSHGGMSRLPRMIGRSRALELFLTGAAFSADDAEALGLAEHVTEAGEALTKAMALAQSFAAKARTAVRAIKRTLAEGEEKPYRNRFLLESQYSVQLLWTEEYRKAQEKARQRAP